MHANLRLAPISGDKMVNFVMNHSFSTPFIQIAGFRDVSEVRSALSAGANQVGFPLVLDHHTEELSASQVGEIVRSEVLYRSAVVITYATSLATLSLLLEQTSVNTLQIHAQADVGVLAELKKTHPKLSIIKSIVIGGNFAWRSVLAEYKDFVDMFLTDTYDPKSGASGATGKTHDWDISSQICVASGKPVMIAGGLTADNVNEVILQTKPAGVDSHTGVENPDGTKSFNKMLAFVENAHTAFKILATQSKLQIENVKKHP